MELKSLMSYCSALEQNNNRAWFQENHERYESAKADFAALLEELRFVVAAAAPALADDILRMSVSAWTYRIPRDMRFYRDKPPYEPSFRAYISRDKKSWQPIGYFLRLAPGSCCFGTGLWCEDGAELGRVRDNILADWQGLADAVGQSGLELVGRRLKRAPRGYDESLPGIEWIKYRDWSLIADIPDSDAESSESLEARVGELIGRMEPVRLRLLAAASGGQSQKQVFEDFYR